MAKKIRSLDEIVSRLQADLTWRKQEIRILLRRLEDARDFEVNVATRFVLVLLYAHWEGFVKYALQVYIDYVSF